MLTQDLEEVRAASNQKLNSQSSNQCNENVIIKRDVLLSQISNLCNSYWWWRLDGDSGIIQNSYLSLDDIIRAVLVSLFWGGPFRSRSSHYPVVTASSDVTAYTCLSCQGWPTPRKFETEAAILASKRFESLRIASGCFGFEFWPGEACFRPGSNRGPSVC